MVMDSLQIALVEDDAILCDLLTIRLNKIGYSVKGMYATGEDAIRSIPKHLPDVILMDITLSGEMDGIDTANKIQENYDIPVVYLTASNDSETFKRALKSGECEYVVKPFTDNYLFFAIELANHKHKLNRRMKDKQQHLEKVLSNSGDAIIATDPEGTITIMNPAAAALTGHTHTHGLKVQLGEVIKMADENGRRLEDPILRVKKEMDVIAIPEGISILTPDGKQNPVMGNVSPIRDDEGRFMGVILTLAPRMREKSLRFL
jgi:PAS domain S-box-containing protein